MLSIFTKHEAEQETAPGSLLSNSLINEEHTLVPREEIPRVVITKNPHRLSIFTKYDTEKETALRSFLSKSPISEERTHVVREELHSIHNATVLHFDTKEVLARSYEITGYLRSPNSMLTCVIINANNAIIKVTSASEQAFYKRIYSTLDSPFLTPLGIIEENPSLLVLPRLSCTLDALMPIIKRIKAQGDTEAYEHAIYSLFEFAVRVMGGLREKGIIHYDIKPENIGYDEQTKKLYLFDFDVSAQVYNPGDVPDTLRGTPRFVWSPEYCAGERSLPFAMEAWALGALLSFIKGDAGFDAANFFDEFKNRVDFYNGCRTKMNTKNVEQLEQYHTEYINSEIQSRHTVSELYDFMCTVLKHPLPEKRPTYYAMHNALKRMEHLIQKPPSAFEMLYCTLKQEKSHLKKPEQTHEDSLITPLEGPYEKCSPW